MQTLISRIANDLRNGNLRSLIFELVVVALGIFLGLQADQWYENRQDLARRQEYMQRLLDNVNADIDSLNRGIELAADRIAMADMLHDSISDLSIPENEPREYLRALQQVTFKFGSGSSARNSTYNELTSTGDMRLIPTSVREKIYEYYRTVDDRELAMDSIDIVQSESFRRFAGIVAMGDLETAFGIESPLNSPESLSSRAIAAAERFRSTEEAVEWLPKIAETQRMELRLATNRMEYAKELVSVLEENL